MTMDGFSFATDVVVRFAETDAQGIAHHASYVVWFEVARVAYLRETVGGYQRLRDEGIESPVVEIHARYLQPARFDEHLRVHARCLEARGARFRFEYRVERDGETIAEGWSRHALVDAATLRPTRMPPWLAAAIAHAEAGAEA
ncbi:MAG: acyl-CoA thioesterase [Gaiellaceae bacterium]